MANKFFNFQSDWVASTVEQFLNFYHGLSKNQTLNFPEKSNKNICGKKSIKSVLSTDSFCHVNQHGYKTPFKQISSLSSRNAKQTD